MLMVAPSGRENDDNSEDTPNSSFVTEVVIGREPLLLVVLALMGWMLVKVNDRASRVKMPEPDNSLGIYRKADA